MLRGASANQSNLSGGTLGGSSNSAPGMPKPAVDSDLVSMFDSSAGYHSMHYSVDDVYRY